MKLDDFRTVHPNWNVVHTLDNEASRSVGELMLLSLLIDRNMPIEAAQVAADAYATLPTGQSCTPADVEELAVEISELLVHQTWREYLDHVAAKIEGEEARLAALKMISIVLAVDGMTEGEQALTYAVGDAFDIDYEIVEDIMRAAWETHHSVRRRRLGVDEGRTPPVKGAQWARERGTAGWSLPPLIPREN